MDMRVFSLTGSLLPGSPSNDRLLAVHPHSSKARPALAGLEASPTPDPKHLRKRCDRTCQLVGRQVRAIHVPTAHSAHDRA